MTEHDPFTSELGTMLKHRLEQMSLQPAPHNDCGCRLQSHEFIPIFSRAESPEELQEMVNAIGAFAYEAALKMETQAAELTPNLQVIEADAAERVRVTAMDYAREILTPSERYLSFVAQVPPEVPPETTWLTLGLVFEVYNNVFAYGVVTSLWAPEDGEDVWRLGDIQKYHSVLDTKNGANT